MAIDSAAEVREASVPWAPRLRFFMGTAQCGRDSEHAVVADYSGPFPYTGRIARGIVEIFPRHTSNERAEALMRELMSE